MSRFDPESLVHDPTEPIQGRKTIGRVLQLNLRLSLLEISYSFAVKDLGRLPSWGSAR